MATVASTAHHGADSQLLNVNYESKSQDFLKQFSNWPLNEIESLFNSVKIVRETEVIRGRFPQGLEEYAARIQVVRPTESISVSPMGREYYAICTIFQHRLHLSVERTGTLVEGQSKPSICPLEITAEKWTTSSVHLTGMADSETFSVTIQYNGETKAAHVTSYGDPGTSYFSADGGSVKTILEAVLKDLGVDDSDKRMPRGVQFLSLLLGDEPTKKVLDQARDPSDPEDPDDPDDPSDPEKYPTLRISIEENKSVDYED